MEQGWTAVWFFWPSESEGQDPKHCNASSVEEAIGLTGSLQLIKP